MKKIIFLLTLSCIAITANAQRTPIAERMIYKVPNHVAASALITPIPNKPGIALKEVSASQTAAMHQYVQSKKTHSTLRTTSVTTVSNWYDEWDQNYEPGISNLYTLDVYQDSNLVDNTTGVTPYTNIYWHGMGMSFDPTDSCYSYYSYAYPVTPVMPDTGQTYTVDSIAFFYKYIRNNTTATGDSLIIEIARTQHGATPPDSGAYALQFTTNPVFAPYCYDETPRFASLRYDMVRDDCADSALLTSPGEIQRIAIPLTAATLADTVAGGMNYFKQALNSSGIKITPGTYCAAYVYFKSGVAYPLGTDASTANFIQLYAGEPRGYTTPFMQSSSNSLVGYPGSCNDALVATSQIEYSSTGFEYDSHNILIPSYAYSPPVGSSTGFDVFYMQFHVTYDYCLPPVVGAISGSTTICLGSSITLTDTTSGGTWSATNAHATVSAGGVVTAVTSGIDTFFYTVTNSCGTTSVYTVINIGLSAGVITGTTPICPGTYFYFSETVSGGTWSATNSHATVDVYGDVMGTSAGIDTILYVVSGSCGSDTASFVVTVLGTSIGDITGDTTVCLGSSITISDTTAGGYWESLYGYTSITPIGTGDSAVVTGLYAGTDRIEYYVYSGACGYSYTTIDMVVSGSISPITGPTAVCTGSTITLADTASGGTWSATNGNATVGSTGVVTGVTNGADTIIYSYTNTCGTISTAKQVVYINPYAGIISGTDSICPISYYYFYDPVAGGTWSATNAHATVDAYGDVMGVSAGMDTILYIVSTTCGSDTASFPVKVLSSGYAGVITGDSDLCAGSTVTLTDTVPGGYWYSTTGLTYVTPIGAGTSAAVTGYTSGSDVIEYEVYGICGYAAASIDITIEPSPSTAYIYGATSACIGSLTTLYDAFSGGVWSASNGNALITSTTGVLFGVHPGLDTIYYYATNACGADTNVDVISVNTGTPDAGVITAASDSVCIDSFLLVNDTVAGGIWSGSYPYNAIVYPGEALGLSAGPDTVIYTVSNACGSAEAKLVIYVNDCSLGVDDLHKHSSEITVFPNPTLDDITISSPVEPIKQVAISNMLGKNVYSATYNTNNVTISLDQLPEGIYIVTINNTKYVKLVKQ